MLDAPVRRSRRATTWATCLVLGLGLGLAGCSAAPAARPTPTTTATATASPTPTEVAPPALMPEGTAAENLPYFDAVITAALAADPNVAGRSYIDALVAAGFDKTTMEVTADTTTKGEPADSIQFSVNIAGECLIGQNGPSTGGYHSVVAPLLATGTCLVGATRQIDW
nr:hypothetical protein [Cryobacterium zongtaii]